MFRISRVAPFEIKSARMGLLNPLSCESPLTLATLCAGNQVRAVNDDAVITNAAGHHSSARDGCSRLPALNRTLRWYTTDYEAGNS